MSSGSIGRPMEILLVEDSMSDGRLALEALKEGEIQHRLTWLWDGAEALNFLYRRGCYRQAPRPDLILLDLGLPEIDGRDVLREIKSQEDLQDLPVVVLTASDDHEDQVRSEMLAVDGYLLKPVDLDKFLRLVKELKAFWHADLILPGAA